MSAWHNLCSSVSVTSNSNEHLKLMVVGKANSTGTSISTSRFSQHPNSSNASFVDPARHFIIPYNTSQSCDIYGPICQIGSITVGVRLGTDTVTTTVPCSSYLTAQSSYLKAFNPRYGEIFARNWPEDWQAGFGRSPECRSYAQVWQSQGEYTFSNCGTNNAIVQASEGIFLPSQIPPGVLRQIRFQVFECCGNCSLDVPEVRLYYFPDPLANEICKNRSTISNNINSSTTAIEKRTLSRLDGFTTAVLSGYTLYVKTWSLE